MIESSCVCGVVFPDMVGLMIRCSATDQGRGARIHFLVILWIQQYSFEPHRNVLSCACLRLVSCWRTMHPRRAGIHGRLPLCLGQWFPAAMGVTCELPCTARISARLQHAMYRN